MKKRMVIKLQINGEKGRIKAMKVAVSASGVETVMVKRQEGILIVIGEDVDSVILTEKLRREMGQPVDLVKLVDVPDGDGRDQAFGTPYPSPSAPHYNPPLQYYDEHHVGLRHGWNAYY